ncbi:MAG: outer membrane beta-barrel protein [Chryseolinea sp.]
MTLLAHSVAHGQILVGPVAGGNYSFTSFGDKDLRSLYKVRGVYGYHVGGHLAFQVRKRFFLHASLVYSTKGRDLTDDEHGVKSRSQYNFIEMPVAYTVDFKIKTGTSREFKYFLGIGPNISYWLGGKGRLKDANLLEDNISELHYKISLKENSGSQNEHTMNVSAPNRTQFGLNFVAGLAFEPADR